ncbi:MAG: signal peptidase I [Sphingomonadaceae bacterium]|nr:signal peptidase I [Sphingomonadaceae bacterium]
MESDAAIDPAPAPEPPSASEPARAAKPAPEKESWGSLARFLLGLFLAALVLRTFIVSPFYIPSGSMLPRLYIGDYLFVAKWPYGYSRYAFPFGGPGFEGRLFGGLPARGDVVVFRYPGNRNEDLVKRVIGLPGDTIEVRGGTVILNGRPLPRERIADFSFPVSPNSPCRAPGGFAGRTMAGDRGESLCVMPRYRETLPDGTSYEVLDQNPNSDLDTFGPVTVPADHVFVMGDNRDDSSDSRVPTMVGGVGMLPVDNLLGRVMIAFWSTDGSAEWLKPWTWFSAARWSRIGRTG